MYATVGTVASLHRQTGLSNMINVHGDGFITVAACRYLNWCGICSHGYRAGLCLVCSGKALDDEGRGLLNRRCRSDRKLRLHGKRREGR